LMIHIWAGVFVFLLVSSGRWFIIENLTRLALLRNLIGAIINIILNYFFIKLFGIVGAAYSTLISYAFAAYFFDLISSKTRVQFFIKTKTIFIGRILNVLKI